eukprot:184102_1
MMQFPWAFDFTQDLLLEFALHCNSGRFGNFFCNCEKERDEQQLWLKTPSLFKYLSALWKLGRFRNHDYIPTKTVLRPRYAVRDMILWDEVYCRFTMHDKDRHASSIFTNNTFTKQPNHSTTSTISDLITNTTFRSSGDRDTSRNTSKSVNHVSSKSTGKNRYHPRSPRISSAMFTIAANKTKQNNKTSPIITSVNDNKRSKPPPPPPKKKKNGDKKKSEKKKSKKKKKKTKKENRTINRN